MTWVIIDLSQVTCNIMPINQAFWTNWTVFMYECRMWVVCMYKKWASSKKITRKIPTFAFSTERKRDSEVMVVRRSLSYIICNVYTSCNIHPFFNNNCWTTAIKSNGRLRERASRRTQQQHLIFQFSKLCVSMCACVRVWFFLQTEIHSHSRARTLHSHIKAGPLLRYGNCWHFYILIKFI